MNILSSLHYWFFMLFLQFTPVKNLEKGITYQYKLNKNNAFVFITVTNKVKKGNKNTIALKSVIIQAPDFRKIKTFTAEIIIKGNKKYLKKLNFQRGTITAENKNISLNNKNKFVFISSDTNFKLAKIFSKKSKITFSSNNKLFEKKILINTKHYRYIKNQMLVDIFNNGSGILRLSVKNSNLGLSANFNLVQIFKSQLPARGGT